MTQDSITRFTLFAYLLSKSDFEALNLSTVSHFWPVDAEHRFVVIVIISVGRSSSWSCAWIVVVGLDHVVV